jgi:hypothetical protein
MYLFKFIDFNCFFCLNPSYKPSTVKHKQLCYIPGIPNCLSSFLLLRFFSVLDFFGLALSLSALIFSNNTDAGSSLGSWGTRSPRNALAKTDW